MFPKNNNLVPPRIGTAVPYICLDCGERFSKKKRTFPKPVKCPKCGSWKCISFVRW